MITDWQFYAFAAPAVILVGLGKGGFSGLGLLSFPLMALVAPPIQAAAIILPILMLQDLIGVWAFRREYSRENLKMLIPGALVGLFVGYLFARTVPDAAILLLVGVISTLFVVFTFVGARRGQVDPPAPNGWSATLWGGISGFTSFIANAGGPPLQVYLLPQKLSPRLYAGTATMFFTVVNYVKFPAFIQLGEMTRQNMLTSAALFPLAVAAVLSGIWLVRRVSAERFYKIVYAFTFIVGLKLIWDGVKELAS